MAASCLRPAPSASAQMMTRSPVAGLPRPCSALQRSGCTLQGAFGTLAPQTTRTSVVTWAKGGVMDAPTTTQQPASGVERSQKRPPIYKVLLHNDNYNKREYVVKVLLKVVEQITVDDAVTCMQEAHETGVALVVACPQDNAERYCEGLRLNGLTSTIEPGGC